MTEDVLVSISQQSMIVQINRPNKKNALTHAMYEQMASALATAEADSKIKSTIFFGSSQCFTSGNDLNEFALGMDKEFKDTPVGNFLNSLSRTKKPVIAAVNGEAIGIGTTMLLHCDLVYAGTNSRFQLPFVDLGLCPEAASSLLLPMIMGHCRAAELLLLADIFDASKALSYGVINEICDPLNTLDKALHSASILNKKPTAAVMLTKKMLKFHSTELIQKVIQDEGAAFFERLQSPEAKEAFSAFQDKRQADFSQFD